MLISTALILALIFTAAAAAEGSLAVNGGFEDFGKNDLLPTGWNFHSYEAEYNSDPGNASVVCEQDPERGAVVHISVQNNDDAALFQLVKVEPSTMYRISCFVKTEGVADGAGANVALRDIIALSDGVYGDTGWHEIELVGKTGPVQNDMIVSCRVGGYGAVSHGEAWFDDLKVEKIESSDGRIVPFYDGTVDETEEKHGTGALLPILIGLAVIAAGAIVFFALKKNGSKESDAAPAGNGKPSRRSAPATLSERDLIRGRSFFDMRGDTMPEPTDLKLHFKKRDWIYVTVVTVVYAAVSLFRLGTLSFPTNSWQANTGDSVRIEFGKPVKISAIWQNSGVSYINYKLITDNGEEIAMDQNARSEYGNMFRWAKLNASDINAASETTGLTLTVVGGDTGRRKDPDLVLNELVVFDENGDKVVCNVEGSAAALFDEQDTVPKYSSYYNGMYFDELYHGRTAFEHIHNMDVYEWTHPPLGKLFIALGILVFGMKPFGWRIAGALFGIAMVPVMYCFGKRLLKRSELALFSTVLFTFDFMHFTMMRIATVDTFGVFFILLMTYFMYKFIVTDIGDDVMKTLKPLALSGIFFGLGCASKWICMYTGVALAILFFVKLILMGVKSCRLDKLQKYKDAKLKKKFWRRAAILCWWCLIFFVIVPAVIYAASYCRYYTAQWKPARQQQIYAAAPDSYNSAKEVKLGLSDSVSTYISGVIKNQKDMYNYHSGLNSDHSAASYWWMWLGDLRPTWFYVGGYGNPHGNVGTISAFGNPAVWVGCTLATFALAFVLIFRRKKFPLKPYFLFVCMASSFLPWVLVTRSTYAYHFYATVPFISLAAGYLLGYWEDMDEFKRKKKGLGAGFVPKIKYIWMGLALLFFILFYPVISGMEVPREYIAILQWVPFHKYEVQNEAGEVIRTYRVGWRFLDYEPSPLSPNQITIIK